MLRKQKLITAVATLAICVGAGVGLNKAASLISVQGDSATSTTQLSVPTKVDSDGSTAEASSVSGTNANAKVTYKTTDNNDTTATYKQQTKSSSSNAASDVSAATHGGQTITLTNGTKAEEQGVMGHILVNWKQGDWTVTAVTDTSTIAHSDPSTVASKVSKQLKSNNITNQSVDKGAVTVYDTAQDSQANEITWQNNKKVSSVSSQTSDTALQIAKSALKSDN
ncbi:hypothetical protein [Secundilactobacillus collinoides]|uniref:Lipoprotein n=2 Tax=Secundilactobacillus collinoides TaxID=33960 RepID=A0A0R2BLA1_SECCO|nr:hypothetical protein [Secundilactobacillus collinoides]KRM76763.1 hypothetical protein FC82_GL001116 [Secundilactobacillus collinoides DSM 20515 = JCM 1123]KZL38948.1 hypothetical protein TY91_11150 [Secundilactobacillus collinoides]